MLTTENGPCTCVDPTKVHELWAYIAEDELGEEGIIAFQFESGPMPLIGADRERMASMRYLAELSANMHHKPVELRRFHLVASEIEVIQPDD